MSGGGGKGSTQTSSVTIPPEVLARYNAVNANAQQVAQTPFQKYDGQFVAPINAQQNAGIASTNSAASAAQPYYGAATNTLNSAQAATSPYYAGATGAAINAAQTGAAYNHAATGLAAAGSQAVDPTAINSASINQYMSPYVKDVANSTEALNNQQFQQAQSGQMGHAISSGAFGGDRSGIAAANLQQQQSLANNSEISGIMNTGYNNALNTAQQQQGVGLSAGQANRAAVQTAEQQVQSLGQQSFAQGQGTSQQLAGLGQQVYGTGAATSAAMANLGSGAQSARLQGAQAQMGVGQLQQGVAQAGDTAQYNQFLQQQSYPFQTAQFMANIAEGTGSLSGSTTTNNSVANGIFSDERLKEDIKPVGKSFDGQTIYSYRYKGDAHTQIGLLAQEVEKKHPGSVGLSSGYKTVDYATATDGASKRGHFAGGGVAGGFNPAAMGQMASDYQAMYGDLLAAHGGVTGGSIVPASSGTSAQLHPAQISAAPQTSAASAINQDVGAANSIGKLVRSLRSGKFGAPPATLGSAGGAPDPSAMLGAQFGGGDLGSSAGSSMDSPSAAPSGVDTFSDATKGLSTDPTTGLMSSKEVVAKGGRIGLAGGGDIPYDNSTGIDIPDDQNTRQLAVAQPPSGGGSGGGLGEVMGDVKTAASIAAMFAKGGRTKFASGGAPDDAIAKAIQTATSPFGKYGSLEGLMAAQQSAPDTGDINLVEDPASDDGTSATPQASSSPASGPAATSPAAKSTPTQASKNPGTGSRANRNNNPGNIESGKFTKGQLGYAGSDGRFAIFDTPQAGRNAQISLLGGYLDKGIDTPLKIANKWAPGSEQGNNPEKYAASIAARLGIKPTGTVTAAMLPILASAQAANEGWKAPKALKSGGRAGFADSGFVDPTGVTYDGSNLDPNATYGDVLSGASDGTDPEKKEDPALAAAFDAAHTPAPKTGSPAGPTLGDAPMPTSAVDGDTSYAEPMAANSGTPKQGRAGVNSDGFVKGIGRGETGSIIPLLAGLGALATTQTNNPFTAMAAGLGAGAQAYQGQRQYGLDQQFVGNQTAQTSANVGLMQSQTNLEMQQGVKARIGNASELSTWLMQQGVREAQGLNPPGSTKAARAYAERLLTPAPNPVNVPSYMPAPSSGVVGPTPAASAPEAPPTPGATSAGLAGPSAAPAAAPATPPVDNNFLPTLDTTTPGGQQKTGIALNLAGLPGGDGLVSLANSERTSGTYLGADGKVQNVAGAIPAAMHQQVAGDIGKSNLAEKTRVNDLATASQASLNNAMQLRTMLVGAKPGTYSVLGGPLEKYRQGAGALLESMGVSPDIATSISGTDVTSSLAADKLRATLGAAAARGSLGSSVGNHPSEFKTFLNSTPGTQLPTAVSAWLIDHNTIPQARNAQARADYVNGLDPAKDDFVASGNSWQKNNPWDPTLKAANRKPKAQAPQAAAPSYPAGTPSSSDAYGNKKYYVNGAWTK